MESGVDIFFVISGFIMVYILKPDSRPGDFWLQRFTRIVPLYWLATIIAIVGGLTAPDWFFGRPDPLTAFMSLLFLPMGASQWPHPLLSPGWTLNYEFAFYTLLALCLIVRRPPFVMTAIVILVVTAVGPWVKNQVAPLGYYADNWQMLEFLLGMAAAVLARHQRLPVWLGLPLAVVGMVLIYLFMWDPAATLPRGLKVGVPAFLVVFGALVSEPIWQRSGPLQQVARLGDASYSIYIVHFFLVVALGTLFAKNRAVHDTLGPIGYVVLAVGLGVGVGVLAHVFAEKPLLRLVRSWLPGRRIHRSLPPQGSLAAEPPRG